MLDQKILEMKDEIVQAVRDSLVIESVENIPRPGMPFGEGVYKALQHALGLSEELGFKAVNLDNMVGYAEYGEGDEMIAVLGHLDVVPAGDGWTYPPFGAEIHEGKIYARGILDDKGPTIGALFALKTIKDLNISLTKRVRIIFGTNEESGSKCVQYYIKKGEELPVMGFTPDARYPIINGEKGILTTKFIKEFGEQKGKLRLIEISGGTAPNVVPSYARAVIECDGEARKKITQALKNCEYELKAEQGENLILTAYGVSAHGSTPEVGKNAIAHLLLFLNQLDFIGELKNYLNFLAAYINTETNGKSLGIYLEDKVSGPLTLNLGTIHGEGSKITFTLNIRYPVTKSYSDFKGILEQKMARAGIKTELMHHDKPLYVEPEEPLIKKLQKVYAEKTGDIPELVSIGGGTYAKTMKNLVAFGPIFKGDPDLDHQPDEYMTVDNLIKNVQIIAAAICELAR